MTSSTIVIVREETEHQPEIDILTADAFGPGRFARSAFRLRENVPHRRDLSFVALVESGRPVPELAGSVIMTDILIGEKPALLLGPLVVSPYHQKIGIGRELMNRSMREAARANSKLVILVGDLPYYARFGFVRIPPGHIELPGPVDPARLLACELSPGELQCHAGKARRALHSGNTG